MIVPNEPELPKSKKGKILYFGIIITIMALVAAVLVPAIFDAVNIHDYYAPGSNTEVFGAPDGTYLQKDWGSFDNSTIIWSFVMDSHDYLGPLHGTWPVKQGVWVPVWQVGVFPVDARLYVTIQNNIVIKAEVKSQMEYGN